MTTWPHLSVTTAHIEFLVQQSPVSRPWMYPRPPFYPLPYSARITLPKELGGNAGLKTAITSNAFVTVHSSIDPLAAPNISLLQQASRREGSNEVVYCFGVNALMYKEPWNGSRFQLCGHSEVKGKVPLVMSLPVGHSHMHTAGGQGWAANQEAPMPHLESNLCCTNMSTQVFICIG